MIVQLFPPKSRKLSGRECRIAYVGRLSPQKNLFSLIDAAQTLSKRGIPVELVFVGDGALRTSLTEYARARGVKLSIVGFVPHEELSQLLEQCTLFALPSYIEGHPKALLEAMACGLPVVGSDVEGIRETIVDGLNGLLCSTNPRDIADKLLTIIENPDLAEKLGKAARETVLERFDLSKLLEKECAMMLGLISQR